jgi:hypothetical protein
VISGRVVGALVGLLCQIAVAIAEMRWAMRMVTPSKDRPPWSSRSSWPVSLTDSISCRTFVADQQDVFVLGRHARLDLEQCGQRLALADLRVGRGRQDRHPRRSPHQEQA